MGLFSFVKEAGEKLLGLDKDDKQPLPSGAGARPAAADPADLKKLRERRMAAAIVKRVEGLGLGVEGLEVKVSDSTATVGGTAMSQADREKVILAVGNVDGIGEVDDNMETAAPKATFYTVQSGDSLSKIAKEHYGDANKYMTIFEANKPMLSHPDKIYPGQVLRIPAQQA